MQVDSKLLHTYKQLLQQTKIQASYQHILALFKEIQERLKQELPQYEFANRVVENQMNFSYFQFTSLPFKQAGFKLQVIFHHRSCSFELWLSGYNRKIQTKYHASLIALQAPFQRCEDPKKQDYLIRYPLPCDFLNLDIDALLMEIQDGLCQLQHNIAFLIEQK